jgi:hypothetical protein
MRSARIVASVIFLALAYPGHAQENEPGGASAAQQRNTSLGAGIKNTFREIGHGIRNGARQVKAGVKDGARQFKRGVAVAQCKDGAYSYTHHKTCNHHGGVREHLR